MAHPTLPGDWTEQFAGSKLDLSSFKLSFSDDFNSLDVVPNNGEGKWFAPARESYGAAKFMSPVGATNPFSVSNGHLTINMKKVDGAWQSGSMQTVNSHGEGFAQEYGYFEIRAAFHGWKGAWPTFWLLPQDTTVTRPEIDIVEAYGGDPDGHHQVVHTRTSQTHAWESNYTGLPNSMFDGEFHTYGARITTDWITVYYDGKELSRFPMSDFFRTPLYMVVSLAMNPAEVAQASGRYDIVLDYARAYSAPAAMERHFTGTAASNTLVGGNFDDVLDGRAGADKMVGGLGNDTYKVDNAADAVVEAKAAGIDWVVSSVSYSLSGRQVEQLTLAGSANINAVGNELNNVLKGNGGHNKLLGSTGSDTLLGQAGNDELAGGSGIDQLTGGTGNDYFVLNTTLNASTNVDRITDFNAAYDTIRLENAVMPGLGSHVGTLASAAFRKSSTGLAVDSTDRIIYETDTGWLNYDGNGNAAGGSVHIAQLTNDLPLTYKDFVVI